MAAIRIETKRGADGLITDVNDIAGIDGLINADNVVIDEPDVRSTRKGSEHWLVSDGTGSLNPGINYASDVSDTDFRYVKFYNDPVADKVGPPVTNSLNTFEQFWAVLQSPDAGTYKLGWATGTWDGPNGPLGTDMQFETGFTSPRYNIRNRTKVPDAAFLRRSYFTERDNVSYLLDPNNSNNTHKPAGASYARNIFATRNTSSGGDSGFITEASNKVSTVAYTFIHVTNFKDPNSRVLGAPVERYVYTTDVLTPIFSMTRSGTTGTVTTTANHGLSNGDYITITEENGSSSSLWVGTYQISNVGANTFDITVDISAPTPAVNPEWSRQYTLKVNMNIQTFGIVDTETSISHGIRIYRTPVTTVSTAQGATDPGVEFQLVDELARNSTRLNTVAGWSNEVEYTDLKSDLELGLQLYTNNNGGKKYLAPPACAVMAEWNSRVWYGNTTRYPIKQLTLTTLDNAVSASSTITLKERDTDGNLLTTEVYTFGASNDPGTKTFELVSSGTPSQNMTDTIRNFVRVVNQASTLFRAEYVSPFDGDPGAFVLEMGSIRNGTADTIMSIESSVDIDQDFSPDLTGGLLVDVTKEPESLYYSELQQPEHVPLANQVLVGSSANEMYNLVPTFNQLVVVKDNSIWQVGGTNKFVSQPVTQAVRPIAPRTTVALDGIIYTLTEQGFIRVFPNVTTISDNLDEAFKDKIVEDNIFDVAFAVADDRRHEIYLGLPAPEDANDDTSVEVFRYNVKTGVWTKLDYKDKNGSQLPHLTAGGFRMADRRVYFGQALRNVDDVTARVVLQRKSGTNTDYQEEHFDVNIDVVNSNTSLDITFTDTWRNLEAGYLIEQGAESQVVTAVVDNGGNSYTVTVEGNTTWSTGAAVTYAPINITMTPFPYTAQNNALLKTYSDVKVLLRDNLVVNFDTLFKTGLDTTEENNPITIVGGGTSIGRVPITVETLVPMTKQAANSLLMTITHGEAGRPFKHLETNITFTGDSVTVVK